MKRSEVQKKAALNMVYHIGEFKDRLGQDWDSYQANAMLDNVSEFIKAQSGLLEVLLKHDEPVEPKLDGLSMNHICGSCGEPIKMDYQYCYKCGRKIGWDD